MNSVPVIMAAHAPDFDLGRVVFILMLVFGGFLQWLTNWWKKKRTEAAKNRQSPPAPEELEARERAWQRQTGGEDPVAQQQVARSPLEDLLKAFREIAAPEMVAPPVFVPPSPKARAIPVVQNAKLDVPTVVKAPTVPTPIVKTRERHPLAIKMALVGGLRQAVVLREILGPPKALQTADDHVI